MIGFILDFLSVYGSSCCGVSVEELETTDCTYCAWDAWSGAAWDLNFNGVVEVSDLLMFLSSI